MQDDTMLDQGEKVAVPAVVRVGELIRTQDNRATGAPIFAVQERRRIYGMDAQWDDDSVVWIDQCNDYAEATSEEAATLEAQYQEDGTEPDCWTRTGFMDVWEFVTACFTEEGCREYLRQNGHNHGETRIYAYGSWRNTEWQTVRDHLAALSPTPISVVQEASHALD